ncbi:YcaO-like family protein [Shouchella sp. 1P09AA]|uniref:YcaO-like family protein n=1 Tax=unclassified Shouchella TaxID=2893065 RepID=UPI0039A0A9DE
MMFLLKHNEKPCFFFDRLKLELAESIEGIITIEHIKEIPENALLVYVSDYFNHEYERGLVDLCEANGLNLLRGNLLGNSCYLGPLTIGKSLNITHVVEKMTINDIGHRFILNSDSTTSKGDIEYNELFLSLCSLKMKELINLFLNNEIDDVTDRIWIVSNSPANISEHRVSKDSYNHGKLQSTFGEDKIFETNFKKISPFNYRGIQNFNIDKMEADIKDAFLGIMKHNHISIQSTFIPMVGAESFLKANFSNDSFGRGFSYATAKKSAILENLERHYNSYNHQGRISVYGSYNELKEEAVNPRSFGLHDDEQLDHPSFTYIKYNDDLKMNWVRAWSLKNSTYVFIPEQMVHYFDDTKEKEAKRYVYESSNGAALGSSLEEALLYGLFENIERDNFFVAFYNKLPLVEVDIYKSNLIEVIPVVEYIESKGYSIHFFDMSMELEIPSIWALMINHNDNAIVKTYSAAGAHFNPESALMSALIETATSVPVYEDLFNSKEFSQRKKDIFSNIDKLTEFSDHVLYYSHEKSIDNFNFVLSENREKRALKDLYPTWYSGKAYQAEYLNEDIKALLGKVFDHYDDVYLTNLSGEGLYDQNLKCVKVCVPGMHPISFGHQYRRLLRERIKKGPVLSGRQVKEIEIDKINKMPHPFP